MHKKNMKIKDIPKSDLAVFEAEINKASDSIYGTLIAHLYIEHLLDRYLIVKVPNEPKLFGEHGLSFANKIKLVKGLGGFNPQLLDSMSKLNSIRNNCAHVFGHQISENEVESLGRTLGKDYKNIINKYPEAQVGALAPIVWRICGQMLQATLDAESNV